jgi:hypothetical protein
LSGCLPQLCEKRSESNYLSKELKSQAIPFAGKRRQGRSDPSPPILGFAASSAAHAPSQDAMDAHAAGYIVYPNPSLTALLRAAATKLAKDSITSCDLLSLDEFRLKLDVKLNEFG